MRAKNEKKRSRATAAQIAKYGSNKRRNLFEYAPVRRRLQYICDFIFHSDKHAMALALGLCYRQLARFLCGHTRLTIPAAATIVARLGIRAEWLLTGSGSVFSVPNTDDYFLYLPRLQTTYRTFNTLEAKAVYPAACDIPVTAPAATFSQLLPVAVAGRDSFAPVAEAMFAARIYQKPVCFFLDADFFGRDVIQLWHDFFVSSHANMLVLTQSAMAVDAAFLDDSQPIDTNTFAVIAAQTGSGYAETFCSRVFSNEPPAMRNRSLLLRAFDMGCPVFVTAEVGEIAAHTNPAVRPPELGAAIGAAAYADMLGFTEQLPRFFGARSGVFLSAADIVRSARWLIARLTSLPSTAPRDFTFVCFADLGRLSFSASDALGRLTQLGVTVYMLPQFDVCVLSRLFSSCQVMYVGSSYE